MEEIHGIVLSGGSSFGLDAAGGVMRYLEERNIGFDVGVARVPIVPDGGHIRSRLRRSSSQADGARWPTRRALKAGQFVEEGSVGAGVGATVGKLFGVARAMKGGVGTSSVAMPDGTIVAALVVVNAFGDILDNLTGRIIAGARCAEDSLAFADTVACLKAGQVRGQFGMENTTLAVVATNVQFNKKEMTKVAQMAQGGLVKTRDPGAYDLRRGPCLRPFHGAGEGRHKPDRRAQRIGGCGGDQEGGEKGGRFRQTAGLQGRCGRAAASPEIIA